MKNPFQPGDQKIFITEVKSHQLAEFDSGMVHPVYSTFALGKDVEWACRLFVLEMREPEQDEEGVGSFLSIQHEYPAPLSSIVTITATLKSVIGREVVCTWIAEANGHQIASGEQIQKIIRKSAFDALLLSIIPQK